MRCSAVGVGPCDGHSGLLRRHRYVVAAGESSLRGLFSMEPVVSVLQNLKLVLVRSRNSSKHAREDVSIGMLDVFTQLINIIFWCF